MIQFLLKKTSSKGFRIFKSPYTQSKKIFQNNFMKLVRHNSDFDKTTKAKISDYRKNDKNLKPEHSTHYRLGPKENHSYLRLDENAPTIEKYFKFLEEKKCDFSLNEIITLLQWLQNLLKDSKIQVVKKKSKISTTEKIEEIQISNLKESEKKILKRLLMTAKHEMNYLFEEDSFTKLNFNEIRTKLAEKGEDYSDYLQKWVENQNEKNEDYFMKFPRMGTLASIMRELGINDMKIWQNIAEFIGEEKYASSFEESMLALEGFSYYKDFVLLQEKAEANIRKVPEKSKMRKIPGRRLRKSPKKTLNVLEDLEHESNKSKLQKAIFKLGKNILYSIRDENQLSYLSLARSLHHLMPLMTDSERYQPLYPNLFPKLYERIENQIFRNLGMSYSSQTILDTMYYFAIEGKGSKKMYEALQIVLTKGKMFGTSGVFNISGRSK